VTEEILRAIMNGYELEPDGTHGVAHWGRVFENGTRVAEATGADVELVQLFAIFHDCRRITESRDRGHGRRGANFASTLRGGLLQIEPDRFELLHYACSHHTDGRTDGDSTVQACWDADRLDLARVWITPDPKFLCTDVAKDPELIAWASERARNGYISSHAEQWLEWVG
jgi:uncharacterized protein